MCVRARVLKVPVPILYSTLNGIAMLPKQCVPAVCTLLYVVLEVTMHAAMIFEFPALV